MKKIPLFIFVLSIFLVSCDSFLDVNEDPNKAKVEDVDPRLLFTAPLIDYSTKNTAVSNIEYSIFAQHIKPRRVITGPDQYIYSPTNNKDYWFQTYNAFMILKKIEQIATEKEYTNMQAQAMVIRAMLIQTAIDRWGDVPFSEAGDPSIENPKFDDAKETYYKLYDLLGQATDLFSTDEDKVDEPFTITDNDPLYSGDVDKWIRFANSLKIRILMRLSSVDDVSQKLQELIDSNPKFIDDNSYNASLEYFGGSNMNANFATYNAYSNISFARDASNRVRNTLWKTGCTPLIDLMNTLNDPRRFSYFDRHIDNTNFLDKTAPLLGTTNGAGTQPPLIQQSFISMYYIREDKSDDFLKASETHLLLAEAYAKGLISGGLSKAKEHFDKGIKASMKEFDGFSHFEKDYTIPSAEIDTYIANHDLSTEADPVNAIHLQQYIALYNNGPELWANWRRTKVPALTAPVGASINTIISRIKVPDEEILTNKNAPPNKGLDEPIFFEKP